MEEIWEEIKGYNGEYQVSNLGRIKSFKRNREKILISNVNKSKYVHQQLRKNSKTFTYLLHRLVADAFIPNPENKPNINHLDNDPTNNCVSNLQRCTQKENIQYAVSQGRMKNNSVWMKGRKPWNTGKNLSEEHKLILSRVKKGKPSPNRKKVINIVTGEIFDSITSALKTTGFKYDYFAAMLRGTNKNITNFKYHGN